jgi:hypothetical protein
MGGQFLKVNFEEDGSGAGGYAKEMSKEYKAAEREMLRAAACDADIIISTALIPGRPAPLLIPKEAVAGMKAGSVTVDLAAETGGNIETTVRDKLIVTENGVKCIGYTDMNSRLSSTSSSLYANNVFKFLLSIGPQTTKNKVYSGDHMHTNQCFYIKRERKVKHIQTLLFIIFIFVIYICTKKIGILPHRSPRRSCAGHACEREGQTHVASASRTRGSSGKERRKEGRSCRSTQLLPRVHALRYQGICRRCRNLGTRSSGPRCSVLEHVDYLFLGGNLWLLYCVGCGPCSALTTHGSDECNQWYDCSRRSHVGGWWLGPTQFLPVLGRYCRLDLFREHQRWFLGD